MLFKFVDCYRKENLRKALFCRIFFKFLGLNSSAVELFIGFLTRGLGFVNNC